MALTPASIPTEPSATLSGKVVVSKIFVHGVRLEAEVGVYPHERGRTQPLIVDVELDVAWAGADRLADTVNYETIVAAARAVVAEGHIELVEIFAEHLAGRCMTDPRVTRARIRVEKPEALAPHAAGAGVEITVVRG
ncbi:dihydroneopterin aldolase [Caulobacter sp. SLTY]|uniref:dihydroneopterin aldolase n=1 Tax=Caulobacter sp. SLTY TaxID=2683262 RepID=UPI001412D3CF|nr:dihydroneopterin aldolase [Caulobacter sp. SLTY]NBB14011.1 dihydroneopterin aldolase [Caulobacter sp. SLTY]